MVTEVHLLTLQLKIKRKYLQDHTWKHASVRHLFRLNVPDAIEVTALLVARLIRNQASNIVINHKFCPS